jgi:hypothetical protein
VTGNLKLTMRPEGRVEPLHHAARHFRSSFDGSDIILARSLPAKPWRRVMHISILVQARGGLGGAANG